MPIFKALVGYVENHIKELEWYVVHFQRQGESNLQNAHEELCKLVSIISLLIKSCVPIECAESILRSLVSLFKCQTLIAKSFLRQNHYDTNFNKVVALSSDVTKHVYHLLPFLEQRASENLCNGKKRKRMLSSKVIPLLVYNIEQYERFVIKLAKSFKQDLTQYVRVIFVKVAFYCKRL